MNKNDYQYSLSLVVISGTTDLASRMGTNGLIKQEKFTKITITNIVKCMKNCDMISFALFTFRMFSSHRFRLVYFSYCDFSYFSLSESWFCTLSLGQIDGSWFDHQRLLALLMFPIGIQHETTMQAYTHIYGKLIHLQNMPLAKVHVTKIHTKHTITCLNGLQTMTMCLRLARMDCWWTSGTLW